MPCCVGLCLLRCCTSRFAHKVPTWGLPFPGGVALLVGGMLVRSDPSSPDCGRIGDWSGGSGSGHERFRLRRKNPFMRCFRESFGDDSRPRVWKRLKLGVSLVGEDDDAGRRLLHDHLDFGSPVHDRGNWRFFN